MIDDELFEKLDAFIAKAQKARENVLAGQYLDADVELDHLILAITKFKTDRIQAESRCL